MLSGGLWQVFWLLCAFTAGGALMALHGGVRASRRDRAAFAEAEKLKVMFEDAVAAIDDGFVLYDSDDRMYICNAPFRNQFGKARTILDERLTYEEQIRRLADSGIVPGIEDKKEEFVQSLLEKRRSEFGVTKVFQTHDGRWIRQRDKKTEAGNIVGLRTDVTDLKEHEIALEKACRKAEAAAEAKSAFLANMSHEIRTPMNGIIGMAELLEETDLDEEQQMCTRTVISSCNALLTLVNDILDFSKAEAGRMTVRKEPFDLIDCVYGVAALLAPNASEKGIEVCTDIPEGLIGWYLGDAGRLRQVLINLVGNAIKFTSEGYVLLSLGYDEEREMLDVRVKDTGIGIPEDKLGSVFAAFEQVDTASTRQYDGAGLGLAISRRLVALMGGGITVTSAVGKGSEFRISMPLPRTRQAEEPQHGIRPVFRQGLSALIVDDLEVNRLILQKNLTAWGFCCTMVASGADALELVQGGAQFDLAILDFQMPGMNGYSLAAEIRACSTVPMVLLSSVDAGLDARRQAELGFAAALMKPVRAARLKQSLYQVLTSGKAKAAAAQGGGAAAAAHDLAGLHILVAEDNRTNQLVIRKILEKYGARVEICSTGEQALIACAEQRPDLVLMDVSMPVMNGLDATRAIRGQEAAAGLNPVPVIALTANAMAADRRKCWAAGMTGFLAKPVRKEELLQLIEDFLPVTAAGEVAAERHAGA